MIPTTEYQIMNYSNNRGMTDTKTSSASLSYSTWPTLSPKVTQKDVEMSLRASEPILESMKQLWGTTKLNPSLPSFVPAGPAKEEQTHKKDASQQTDGLDTRIMEAYQKGFAEGFKEGFAMRLQQMKKGSEATFTPPPSVASTMSDDERVRRDVDATPSPIPTICKVVPSETTKVSKTPSMYAAKVSKAPQSKPQTCKSSSARQTPSRTPEAPSKSTTKTPLTASYDPVTSWDDFPVSPDLLREVRGQGFSAPVSIQQRVVVPIVHKRDVVMQAPAGAGKTLAFVMGMVQRWKEVKMSRNNDVFAIIIVPGKLLAEQCAQCVASVGGPLGMRHLVAVGGRSRVYENKRDLKRGVDVVIGTPGRMEHLVREHAIRGRRLHMLIMDEVDTLLGENHFKIMQSIVTKCATSTQIVASSATLNEYSMEVLTEIMSQPIVERVEDTQLNTASVKHHFIECHSGSEEQTDNTKFFTCVDLLRKLPDAAQTIVFVSRRSDALYVHESLLGEGVPSRLLHGEMTSHDSQEALAALAAGTCACLVATDVVARGMDFPGLNTVINFNLMSDVRYYLHRTGRVGRRGRGVGVSISLVSNRERELLTGVIAKTYGTKFQDLPADLSNIFM